jgi:polyisoprenoid-binding protein YceI
MQTQPVQAAGTPRLGHYEIDARHSAVTFRTRHLFGLAPVRGAFTITSGTVEVAEPLAGSRIHAEIDAASFRTGHPLRDPGVRSARFLDADRHPVITFDAERIDGPVVTAVLAVRGVARAVSLAVDLVEPAEPAPGAISPPGSFTARARMRVDRTEFGITAVRGLAARYLELSVEVRCVRK